MQVEVSMYLETVTSLRSDVPPPRSEAEERRTSRPEMEPMSAHPFQLHEERLELGRPGVRVERRRREEVGERAQMFWLALVSPVNGEADVPERVPVDLQLAQALRHHGRALDRPARRRETGFAAVLDSLLLRKLLRDLDEEARLQLVEDGRVVRPIVVMLGQSIGRTDDRELIARAEHVLVRLEPL